MSTLGIFRDDYYNSISVLAAAQYTATAQASGVWPAQSSASF
jgi:hypothetical protein